MIDYFALALTHGLLLVGLVRLLTAEKLDQDDVATLAETDAVDAANTDTSATSSGKNGRGQRGQRNQTRKRS